jgi:hypothetical protein
VPKKKKPTSDKKPVELSIENLVSLGPEKLAKMLLEEVENSEALSRRVELSLVAKGSVKELAKHLRRKFKQCIKKKYFIGKGGSFQYSNELDDLRMTITEKILPEEPETAAQLLEEFIDLHTKAFYVADDSYGVISDVFRQAVKDWGTAWSRVQGKDTATLARKVYAKHIANDYGVYDEIVPALGEALEENGIAVLEQLALEELKKLPAIPDDDKGRQFDEPWSARCRIGHIMEGIADIRKDPDSFIEAAGILGRKTIYGVEIAERLMAAGRFDEALEWLKSSTGVQRKYEIPYLKAECLITLGRQDDARDVLWKHFLQTFDSKAYKEAFSLAKPEEHEQLQREAMATAIQSSRLLDALSFLVAEGFLREAASLVLERRQEIDGSVYTTLGSISKILANSYPLPALVLHRVMAEAVLEKGVSKYYGHAVRDLRAAERLGLAVTEWHGFKNNGEYIQELRVRHRLKKAFWERYEK